MHGLLPLIVIFIGYTAATTRVDIYTGNCDNPGKGIGGVEFNPHPRLGGQTEWGCYFIPESRGSGQSLRFSGSPLTNFPCAVNTYSNANCGGLPLGTLNGKRGQVCAIPRSGIRSYRVTCNPDN
ncbi:hypothetical protein EJ03DRAFT_331905 [Teratosphaeria nubilosa]|uniref:Uncharacterized protein n=1 Tax=Teratosphaeria nubilosa TaxID=161662 RepID=A0A6G1KUS3_9PEZI|nr:hypothetical protein EJ03DRAFT_331905 [Teratosphaeria nubilosa]